MILGIIVITAGFLAAHSVASSWVGRLATASKGHASSLYLLACFRGSSIVGSAGGWLWSSGGWCAVAGFTSALLLLAALAAMRVTIVSRRREDITAGPSSPALTPPARHVIGKSQSALGR